MNRSESIVKIAVALLNAQRDMGNAVKDSKNPFFKSTFATLNAVREASLPVLNKHGVSVFQPTTVIDGKLYVETMLLHESGEYISGLYEVVPGKQNDPQAFGAAVSYSRRYALQAMVNIGAEDDDAESSMGRTSKASEKAPPAKPAPAPLTAIEKQNLVEQAKAAGAETLPPAKKGFGVKQPAKTETAAGTEDGWS